ncbi:DUF2938 domain-containing protein [Aestuariirhabdus sp. Z084]|uniref:DUF2938 domain-containing protein n=1 Tax=Aestuariirhabdus haliotis TaxID=2918751 RepID=UPI00201B3D49|nr:DUF2938 domain-containing protein [Aestuariirhabdus haliotis]MCL6416401.1 DUF2938 domain-containing protein [Aestuariirhabdus haliotis]MCL6420433.1 DUF2938 domain-containing protein [Aestuariirhabdus haliotis]
MSVLLVLAAVGVGLGATLLMDLWAWLLRRAFNIASLDYCLLGRWISYMPSGVFTHGSIAEAPRKGRECRLGWFAHYQIGVLFALVLLLPAFEGWFFAPTLAPAMAIGLVTALIPFCLMQPALGFGLASSKAPRPWFARLKTLTTHAVFGLGLYLGALPVSYLLVAFAST